MSRYTDAEIVLAEQYLPVLDFVSRAAQAVDEGNWRYLWDKLAQLRHAVARLEDHLSTDPGAEGERGFRAPPVRPAAVRAAVAQYGRPYRAARLLHPEPTNPAGGGEQR
jgi:hypothetical protein